MSAGTPVWEGGGCSARPAPEGDTVAALCVVGLGGSEVFGSGGGGRA